MINKKKDCIYKIITTIIAKKKKTDKLKYYNRRLIQKIRNFYFLVDDLRNKHIITENISVIFLVCINFNDKHKKIFNEISFYLLIS